MASSETCVSIKVIDVFLPNKSNKLAVWLSLKFVSRKNSVHLFFFWSSLSPRRILSCIVYLKQIIALTKEEKRKFNKVVTSFWLQTKMIEDTMLTAMHQDLELRRQDWQLLNEHKKADKDRRRRSLMLRTESAHEQRMAEEKLRARKALEAERDAYLRSLDHQAVMAYKREEEAHQRADALNSSVVL